ncbi:MAG: anti-sigma regulatory factor [Planctomycetota bacterium]|nr:anti-sigma regulatory factor [Planctomycetota bacterium]
MPSPPGDKTLMAIFRDNYQDLLTTNIQGSLPALFGQIGRRTLSEVSLKEREQFFSKARSILLICVKDQSKTDTLIRLFETQLRAQLVSQAFAPGKRAEPPTSNRFQRPTPNRFQRPTPTPHRQSPNSQLSSSGRLKLKRSRTDIKFDLGMLDIDCPINNAQDILSARKQAMNLAIDIGFSKLDSVKLATCVSELSRNIVLYAESGMIKLSKVNKNRSQGLKVIARDDGPGIPNLNEVMLNSYRSKTGLGRGLKAVKDLVDDFDIVSRSNFGTRVQVTKWLGPR